MPEPEKQLTEAQRKAAEFMRRPKPDFSAWRAEREAEEKKQKEEEMARAIQKAEAGDLMPDGTICAGVSPDTNRPMFVTPVDASLTMKFNQAQEYAERLDAYDHDDWRLPTKEELDVLYQNREKGALKGTFNLTGETPAGYYWSSTPCGTGHVYDERFNSDGPQSGNSRNNDVAVRCVR